MEVFYANQPFIDTWGKMKFQILSESCSVGFRHTTFFIDLDKLFLPELVGSFDFVVDIFIPLKKVFWLLNFILPMYK